MRTFAIISFLLGSSLAIPAKLDQLPLARSGYDYSPPKQPSGLYELPVTTTTTTTTTPPPPPPPDTGYLPPAQPSEHKPVIESALKSDLGEMLMPYEFSYGVDDAESGVQIKHSANSDGAHVTGEYSVMLPDGRLQVVKFKSNPDEGYTADVSYL